MSKSVNVVKKVAREIKKGDFIVFQVDEINYNQYSGGTEYEFVCLQGDEKGYYFVDNEVDTLLVLDQE